jgi:Zn-dependent peptidase ImmA (M78 family)
MHNETNRSLEGQSVLALLRSVVPPRRLQYAEALRVAELQANRLLEVMGVGEWPVPSEIVTELPRLRVELRDLPASGLSFWDGQTWVVFLNETEATTRQRFTLLHEFKHIMDHGRADKLYTGNQRLNADEQAEQVADYFAGCVLMPKRLIKRAWGEGRQRPRVLAAMFHVSPRAVEFRLAQLGLTLPRVRCAPVSGVRYKLRSKQAYLRQLPSISTLKGVAG